jgi:hypothetical protein
MTVPVFYENSFPFPPVITEAYIETGESARYGGADSYVPCADEGPPGQELIITVKVMNQGIYPISQLDLAIENPTFLPDDVIKIMLLRSDDDDWWAERVSKNRLLEPQEGFTFNALFYLRNRIKDLESMNYLSDFQLRVVGIKYETKKGRVDQWWDEINTEWLIRGVSGISTRGLADTRGWSDDGPDNLEISIMYVNPPLRPAAPEGCRQ